MQPFFIHASAYVDDGAEIGAGTKVWHFCHIMPGARIGAGCNLGQNVNIADGVVVGDNVKIQNNVSIYTGTIIEDDVFLGPSCVLTNIPNPRSQIVRHNLYEKTFIRRGATIGANATIVCGVTLGRYCFVAAGAVVTRDVADYALMIGNPSRQNGWMSRHGHRLTFNADGIATCPESGYRYKLQTMSHAKSRKNLATVCVNCLDLDEENPLPAELRKGTKGYRELKQGR
jgi:UDP-2-acetamido-3-amino-2,3-dideoxy-glucuronate N-acetyltransferase